MDVSLFGYKVNVQILILIGVIFLIMTSHLFCGCSRHRMFEGFVESDLNMNNGGEPFPSNGDLLQTQDGMGLDAAGNTLGSKAKDSPSKAKGVTKEGFVGANTNYGQSSQFDLESDEMVDTSSWFGPDLVISPGKPLSPAVLAIENRPDQPVPLPEGQLLMFENTAFKPECCPSTYTNSMGCACMTVKQNDYLIHRGGNNVPYSEY